MRSWKRTAKDPLVRAGLHKALSLSFVLSLASVGWGSLAYPILTGTLPSDILSIWNRWDTVHYLFIAEHGYPPSGAPNEKVIVFWPLYPWLIRAFTTIGLSPVFSALLVSNLACIAASVLLYRLVSLDHEHSLSIRAVFYLLIFPTAYFLHLGYSESVFLALLLGSFLSARLGAWQWAGVTGFFAVLTRLPGIALIPAIFTEYLLDCRDKKLPWVRKELFWVLAPAIALLVYLSMNLALHHDAFAFLRFQRLYWYKEAGPIWNGFLLAWHQSFLGNPHDAIVYGVFEWVAALLGLAFVVWSFKSLRISYSIFIACSWLILAISSFWQSTPRYLLPLFPIYLLLAKIGKNTTVHATLTFIGISLSTLFLMQFIQGRWAF